MACYWVLVLTILDVHSCIRETLIDPQMERTPREHLDIYICAIKGEESTNFWLWSLDMWLRIHPEMVTSPWKREFKASVFPCYTLCIGYLLVDACICIPQHCLEQSLDWNGAQAAKDYVAASYYHIPSP